VKRIVFLGFFLGAAIPEMSGAQPGNQATPVSAIASVVRIPVRSDSRLWLEGSSNVRDWTCKATAMDATLDVSSASGTRQVRGVAVQVPVRMLKCGDRHMEAHLYKALGAPQASAQTLITAEFGHFPNAIVAGESVQVNGEVTVAGVQRTVTMNVRSDRLPDGSYRARGNVPILMTDFGIKPPRPWGGILKTADRVVIQFEIFIPVGS